MAFYQFRRQQLINTNQETLWNFISSPGNLSKITPEHMNFHITTPDLPDKMYKGMIIAYRLRLFSAFKATWITEISNIEEGKYFVDTQLIGPYKLWHHQHILTPADNGILMTDIVSYAPPLGIFGRIANYLFIKRQLNNIFNYREKALNNLFK